MIDLHEEDSSRWTSTTLSARYSAPIENVSALLKLAYVRKNKLPARGDRWRGMKDEDCGLNSAELEALREQIRTAWKALPEVKDEVREVGPAVASESIEKVEAVGEVVDDDTGDEQSEEDVSNKEVVEKSVTAQWIESVCDHAARDVERRTTFAFIEVGGKGALNNVQRAVWLRDGATGKLRVANEDERDILIGNARVADKEVWG